MNDSLLMLGTFMGAIFIAALCAAARAVQRREAAARRGAEEELRKKTSQLADSNKELASFASIVSHELQEPLRKMLTFSELIAPAGKAIGPEDEENLQRVKQAARRMQKLVEDILSLSRVTTQTQPFEAVDLNMLVDEALVDFTDMLHQIGGTITVDRLPIVQGDPKQLHRLFVNLISNALKFRRKDEALKITVSSRQVNAGFMEITMKDNGVGFDEQYVDKLFKPFQRLHRPSEYPGSGIGLAICRRILQRHGGAIEAHGKAGQGASFIMTLPV